MLTIPPLVAGAGASAVQSEPEDFLETSAAADDASSSGDEPVVRGRRWRPVNTHGNSTGSSEDEKEPLKKRNRATGVKQSALKRAVKKPAA